ncbi:Protein CUP-SHAPED COTYLEDON [Orobanche hederae]
MISNQQNLASKSCYPPGFRFMPTDKELIIGYLRKKVNNEPIPVAEIIEVDLYKFTPKYLTENYSPLGKKEWYFFTMRDRRYPNGNRPKRSVEGGIGWWKATGGDKLIRSNGKIVGKKKVLVFYYGKNKSGEEKTKWIMHEYKLDTPSTTPSSNNMRLDDWVLCRIYERNNKKIKDVDEDDDVDQVNNNLVVSQPNYENNNNIEDVQPLQIRNNNINVGINQNYNHYDQGQEVYFSNVEESAWRGDLFQQAVGFWSNDT